VNLFCDEVLREKFKSITFCSLTRSFCSADILPAKLRKQSQKVQ
jgi:hypothetical protein